MAVTTSPRYVRSGKHGRGFTDHGTVATGQQFAHIQPDEQGSRDSMNERRTQLIGGVAALAIGTIILLGSLIPGFGVPSATYIPAAVAIFVGVLFIGLSRPGHFV